jgi:hypothetical protein
MKLDERVIAKKSSTTWPSFLNALSRLLWFGKTGSSLYRFLNPKLEP